MLGCGVNDSWMSCPWFYSKNGSDYVAVGSTVTGNNKLFWVISLKNLDSSGGTLARTYTQSRRAELTVKRLRLNRSWLLTGQFSSNGAVQIQLSVSLKKVWGSKISATVQLAWITSSYMVIRCFSTKAYLVKSDAAWPTYPPKNMTSYICECSQSIIFQNFDNLILQSWI